MNLKKEEASCKKTREDFHARKEGAVIHPRYTTTCHLLTEQDDQPIGSTIGIRILLCILLMAAYITLEQNYIPILDTKLQKIPSEIIKDYKVTDILNICNN